MNEKKKNSILVVDDENLNIMAISHILSDDYIVYAAKNGQNAINAAEKYMPDLILLDILMPEMDGYTVLSKLKNSEKTQHIPVIFVTGLSNTNDEEKGLSLGAVDYISKPFSPAIVKLRVKNQIKIINQTRLIIEKEIEEKSSRARSEFISRISHEMRTPMNTIMGMTTLINVTDNAEKRNDMLEKLSSASNKLLNLIDDVLDMSDIEGNKLRLGCYEFSFSDMMKEIVDKVKKDVNIKRQSLTTNIDPSIPDSLLGDDRRIGQVIWNLLSNAVKFTPDLGSVHLNASGQGVDNETITIKIEVIDDGLGIKKEMLERLFIPFEQADGGIDRKFGGAGLGLTIAKYITDLMGGEITVESEHGKGSRFTFTFKTKINDPENERKSKVSLDGRTALMADDIEINREIAVAMLESAGMLIECAQNGIEAFEMFASDPGKFDIILMDINMPEMDGIESTRRIRAFEAKIHSDPNTQRQDHEPKSQIPIIAMTANVVMSEVETYFAAGMTDHIGKPLDFDKLMSKIQKYLIRA